MNRSAGLQLVGLMLAWVGLRFVGAVRAQAENVADANSLLLVLSAAAVGGSALFAAVAVFRGNPRASAIVTIWAVLLFIDVVLQQVFRGARGLSDPMTLLVLAGIACLLAGIVLHVRHYTSRGPAA